MPVWVLPGREESGVCAVDPDCLNSALVPNQPDLPRNRVWLGRPNSHATEDTTGGGSVFKDMGKPGGELTATVMSSSPGLPAAARVASVALSVTSEEMGKSGCEKKFTAW